MSIATKTGKIWIRLMMQVVMPVIVANLGGYIAWLLKLPDGIGLGLVVFGVVLGLRIEQIEIKKIWKSVILAMVAMPVIVVSAAVLLPVTRTININDFDFVVRPSTTDYFKHLYAVTALVDGEVPPVHPFFTTGKFIYYYGYYFIPAAITKMVPALQGSVVYLYALVTGILGWVAISKVVGEVIQKWWVRVAVMMGLVWGTSADIWPTLLDNRGPGGRLIELWAITHKLGFRIDNIYTSYLWTPQHFFAAAVAIAVWWGVWKGKVSWVVTSLSIWFVAVSSAFVAMALGWGLLVVLLVKKSVRKELMIAGVVAGILTLPMAAMLVGKAGIFARYTPVGYSFTEDKLINLAITWVVEYGLILVTLPIWIWTARKRIKYWYGWLLGGGVPVVATWMIQSAGYNDFLLRGMLPIQIMGLIGFGKLFELQRRTSVKVTMAACLVISIAISSLGFGYEFAARWRENVPTNPETSSLLLKVRKLPIERKLMAIGRDEWIYLIPSMGYKPVLTSALYDSGQYLEGPPDDAHYKYEVKENELFFATVKAQGKYEVTEELNRRWRDIREFFTRYPADDLLVSHNQFLKEGINPWLKVYEKMGIGMRQLGGSYSLANIGKIDQVLKSKNIVVNYEKGIAATMMGDKLNLPQGVQVLVTCRDIESKWVRFELVAHYSIFNEMVDRGFCLGRIFYNPAASSLEVVMGTNSFEQIWSYPVEIQ